MQSQSWQPVLPSHFLRAGENIVAGFLSGQELAVWRSGTGSVQAWDNRCPHRGTRLTLGRIINNNLSCAYHGWEFTTQASCAAIPANPSLPLPKNLRVKTFPVMESGGMVWVSNGEAQPSDQSAADAPSAAGSFFCRSIGIRADGSGVRAALELYGFKAHGEHAWHGDIASLPAVILLNAITSQLTVAHAWLRDEPSGVELTKAQAELRIFRRDIEANQN